MQNKKFYALGRLKLGAMNKTELAYDGYLKTLQMVWRITLVQIRGNEIQACR